MPRLPPALFRQARAIDPLLYLLLPVCRDLHLAQNELRWIREHASKASKLSCMKGQASVLQHYVQRRSQGEPLQYILGSEYFGDLEIKCEPGVLIPRQDTAASVTHLVNLLCTNKHGQCLPSTLRVIDLCTGTGCIPLLFHHDFYSKRFNKDRTLSLVGVDISRKALRLARKNKAMQLNDQRQLKEVSSPARQALNDMAFVEADVLSEPLHLSLPPQHPIDDPGDSSKPQFDILISNPPYISSSTYNRTTSRSVRNFEPKSALVPPASAFAEDEVEDGDIFYPRLLQIARKLDSQIILFEVADLEQAVRVAGMVVHQGLWDGVEIWRDEPGAELASPSEVAVQGRTVPVLGRGNGRSVMAHRGSGTRWLGRT